MIRRLSRQQGARASRMSWRLSSPLARPRTQPAIHFVSGGTQEMSHESIQPCTLKHLERYGEIYASAFSGEPWNDPWKAEDAVIHVKELLESRQSYGLEYVIDGEVAGFILGTSMLFHYGRTFEINDLAVAPEYQRRGIGAKLLEKCIADVKAQGMAGIHLITAGDGILPAFYEEYGFTKENEVILMGLEL